MTQWQPIETAPKDGTIVLVFSPTDGTHSATFEVYWSKKCWNVAWNDCGRDGDVEIYNVTHWMPLPPAPEPTT